MAERFACQSSRWYNIFMDNNQPVNPGDSLASAPPPPSEVKIRTMRSDLESMTASGGGLPRFANVKVSGLDAPKTSGTAVVQAKSKNNLILIIMLVALVALAVVAGLST